MESLFYSYLSPVSEYGYVITNMIVAAVADMLVAEVDILAAVVDIPVAVVDIHAAVVDIPVVVVDILVAAVDILDALGEILVAAVGIIAVVLLFSVPPRLSCPRLLSLPRLHRLSFSYQLHQGDGKQRAADKKASINSLYSPPLKFQINFKSDFWNFGKLTTIVRVNSGFAQNINQFLLKSAILNRLVKKIDRMGVL